MREAKNKYRLPLNKGDIILPKKKLPTHRGQELKELEYAVDFLVQIGTPIYAALGGKVFWIKDDSKSGGKNKKKYWNLGNRIVISHKNEEYTAYEHLKYKGIVVKVDQRVKKGQLIGYSGNTGWSTIGSHLHFEVFIKSIKDKSKGKTIPFSFENFPLNKYLEKVYGKN